MTRGPKTPPVLRTTFKIITDLQNVRATLYETVSQVSSEKKKTVHHLSDCWKADNCLFATKATGCCSC